MSRWRGSPWVVIAICWTATVQSLDLRVIESAIAWLVGIGIIDVARRRTDRTPTAVGSEGSAEGPRAADWLTNARRVEDMDTRRLSAWIFLLWTVFTLYMVVSIVDAVGRRAPGFEAAPFMLFGFGALWLIAAFVVLVVWTSKRP